MTAPKLPAEPTINDGGVDVPWRDLTIDQVVEYADALRSQLTAANARLDEQKGEIERFIKEVAAECGQRDRADAGDHNLASFKWALDTRIAERDIAVGLASTLPQFSDKHPEEVLEFIKAAAIEALTKR